ncbi:glutathione transferase GstA [Bartonella sp. HY038]|uniref:glutathione transferase GstA n=1 Tax=Bartonella sp. HY038 TaxID=2759660 RepID=UPI0015FAC877|nr:glutathione transferase GstA [Bartonella sp. HY038]
MKLYFSPFACSLSPHIVASELGIKLDLVKVDLASKATSDGRNYIDINPKGYVPALELDDGRIITEGPAITQYLNDNSQAKNLAPACGTFERAKVQEWLNFIGTELHKGFGPLFYPATPEEYKKQSFEKIQTRLKTVEIELEKAQYLANNTFSLADIYLFVVLNWAPHLGLDLSVFPAIQAFHQRIGQRPAVIEAIAAEQKFQ